MSASAGAVSALVPAAGAPSVTAPAPALDVDVDPAHRHALHDPDGPWPETNCYVDVWVELLHRVGLDPVPCLGVALGADFDGTQWTFLKPAAADLWDLYGIDVRELNVWQPVHDHVLEQLELGRPTTVEVDAWWLPDTAGVSYRREHTKTTIVPLVDDPGARRLVYLHGQSCHELVGEDYDGVWPTGPLAPYTEVVDLAGLRVPEDLPERAVSAARRHLARRPGTNPVARMGEDLGSRVRWLAERGDGAFHLYAFATCRQCGAGAALAAALARWLGERTGRDLSVAAGHLDAVADGAQALQFSLARAARGRSVDLAAPTAAMADRWARAMALLETALV